MGIIRVYKDKVKDVAKKTENAAKDVAKEAMKAGEKL